MRTLQPIISDFHQMLIEGRQIGPHVPQLLGSQSKYLAIFLSGDVEMPHEALLIENPVVDDVADAMVIGEFHHRADDVNDPEVGLIGEFHVFKIIESL